MAVAAIDLLHDVEIGTAVTHVDRAVGADEQLGFQFLKHCHLAIASSHLQHAADLARRGVELEFGAENVIRWHDALQGRADHIGRAGGNDVERKPAPRQTRRQYLGEQGDVVLEVDPLAGGDEVLAAHASERRVMPQQVGQFSPLLDEIAAGESGDFFFKIGDSHDLAEDEAGVVETERLIEVAGDQIFGDGFGWCEKGHGFLSEVRPRRSECAMPSPLKQTPCHRWRGREKGA